MSGPAPTDTWHGHMFGLGLHSEVALAGCPAGPVPPGLATTRLRIATRREVAQALPPDAQPLRPSPGGRRAADVVAHHQAGYRLPAPGFGAFHVSPSGAEILAAPNAIPDWRWQRYLIGRVLPFAALLRGLEPLHASAIATPSGAVVIAGESRTGKSTLAALLVLAGCPLLADDVVALRAQDGVVYAHPGAHLLSLRPDTAQRLGPAALRRLGARVGSDGYGIRLAVARAEARLAVRAVYVLTAEPPGAGSTPAARLLGSTFNAVVRDRPRVVRQLDVCAALARCARITELPVAGDQPETLADQVLAELEAERP